MKGIIIFRLKNIYTILYIVFLNEVYMKEKKLRPKGERKKEVFFLLAFFIFSIVTLILGILVLDGSQRNFIEKNFILLSVSWGIFVVVTCLFFICFFLWGKETVAKSGLSLYTLLIFSLTIGLILQRTGFFTIVKNSESLRAYLQKAGAWMPIFYVLLQFLQVVILPIPSIVSTVAGITLFGAFWTMIYSLIGILLGSFVAFIIGRKLGYRAATWMVGEENLKKWQKKMKGKDNFFLSLMFLLPIFPDDILCFLAGLSSMSTKFFLIIITISRVLAISATCYSFYFIPFNTWWGITLWGMIISFFTAVFIAVYKNMEKLQKFFRSKKKKRNGRVESQIRK